MNELEKAYQEIERWHCYSEQEGFVGEEEISYLNYIKKYINDLQSKIDKANEIIKDWEQNYNGLMKTNNIYIPEYKPSLFDLRNVLNDNKIEEIPQFKGTMEQLDKLCEIKK